ncbi:unnamed protein product [Peniophora sp. CBMAI 1063]|nr:unnamed protein product [Peniophora sp. CBMAI 1063]
MGSYKRSRAFFYVVLFAFSTVALSLSAGRLVRIGENAMSILNYTPWDRQSGKPYDLPGLIGLPLGQIVRYEKILTEVLVGSLFCALWALYALFTMVARRKWNVYTPTIALEVGALSVLWLLMLFGAALANVEHDLWYQYSSYMTIIQRLYYPYAFECWFSGSCDDLRAMIAFSWLTWIVLSLLIIFSIAGPASNGALVPFMASMNAGAEPVGKTVVFDEEAFEYHTAPLIGRESSSSEYVSAPENQSGAEESTEKSRLVEDVD